MTTPTDDARRARRAHLLPRGRRALATAAALAALAPLLAACGSSSDGGGASAAASTTTAASGAGTRDRAALQACLREQGVELPTPPAGAGAPPSGDGPPQGTGTTPTGPPQGTGTTPAGTPPNGDRPPGDGQGGPPSGADGRGGDFGRDLSDAERRRMQAAFEKCGARFGGGFGRGDGPGGRSGRPNAAALARFVACVRRNGYDLPDPDTSGDGPVFDDRAVDRDDPAFVKASRACQRYLTPSS